MMTAIFSKPGESVFTCAVWLANISLYYTKCFLIDEDEHVVWLNSSLFQAILNHGLHNYCFKSICNNYKACYMK